MIALIVYLLAAWGFAYVVGHSTISHPFRLFIGGDEDIPPLIPHLGPFLMTLVECPPCLGTWVGFGVGPWLWPLLGLPVAHWTVASFTIGMLTAGSNFILSRVTRLGEGK